MATLSENTRGAVLMMASMAAFTLNDACMKSLSGEVPLFQAIFLRGLMTTALLVAAWRISGASFPSLTSRDKVLIAVRTIAEIAAAFLFISAIFHMPLANATAVLQALPLTVTLAGALFLGESIGRNRLLAILAGLAGVLIILRPQAEGFDIYSLYALGAVAAVTLRDLAVRRISPGIPTLFVALMAAAGVTISGGVASLTTDWQPLTISSLAGLAGAAVFIIGGYIFSVMTMRTGDTAFVAPFRYTSLLWALLLGLFLFGEWPTSLTLLGAAIVVGSGLFTWHRERRVILRQA